MSYAQSLQPQKQQEEDKNEESLPEISEIDSKQLNEGDRVIKETVTAISIILKLGQKFLTDKALQS